MKHMNTLCGQCAECLNVTAHGLNLYFLIKTLKSVYFILNIVILL